jgi:hypothetical protein
MNKITHNVDVSKTYDLYLFYFFFEIEIFTTRTRPSNALVRHNGHFAFLMSSIDPCTE